MRSCKGNEKTFKGSNVEGLGAMVGLQLGCRWAAMASKRVKKPLNPRARIGYWR